MRPKYYIRNGRIYTGAMGQLCAAIENFEAKINYKENKKMATETETEEKEDNRSIFEKLSDMNREFSEEIEDKLQKKFIDEVIDYESA